MEIYGSDLDYIISAVREYAERGQSYVSWKYEGERVLDLLDRLCDAQRAEELEDEQNDILINSEIYP